MQFLRTLHFSNLILKGGIFTIYDKIVAEYQRLEKLISKLEEQLKSFPNGNFYCSRSGKYYKWLCSPSVSGEDPDYIYKDNRDFAELMTLKKYLSYRLEEAIEEKSALDFYFRHHKTGMPKSDQMLLVHPEYQKLLSPYFKPASQQLEDWQNAPYEKCPYKPEHLKHPTKNGMLVRSKSEALIDMYLYEHKIPSRYECALLLGDATYYPDFTIRHPKTGKTYYWEHFGRADDPEYSMKIAPTLNAYIAHGIIPSINLITTFETLEHPLGIDTIENIVEQYFL